MKKLVLISLLLVVALSAVNAQATYGIRLGGNVNKLEGDLKGLFVSETKDWFSKTELGLNFGVFMNYPIDKYLLLQPEINYSQRGGRQEGDYEYWDDWDEVWDTDWDHIEIRLHYLELPLYLKGAFSLGDFSFEPYMGPEFRYLIKGYLGKAETPDDELITEESKTFNKFDPGFGVGLDLAFKDKYMLGVRYSKGFHEIVLLSFLDTKSLQLNLGYRF